MLNEHLNQSKESKEAKAVRQYLENLGLSVKDLDGKRVLDVGSGGGTFVRFANAHGAKAMALDNGNNLSPETFEYIEKTKTPFVKANAYEMPFEDASFNLVVSHAAIPNIANQVFESKEYKTSEREVRNSEDLEQARRIKSLQEMLRVLEQGGEIRCAPVVGDMQKYKGQSHRIREAIDSIKEYAEVVEEPLNLPDNPNSFRLIIRKKQESSE